MTNQPSKSEALSQDCIIPCTTGSFSCRPVKEVVAWEQRIAEAGLPLFDLMKRAGSCVAKAVVSYLSNTNFVAEKNAIALFAGTGNNGGDAWVVASILFKELPNYQVVLVTPRPPEDITSEPARSAIEEVLGSGFEILVDPSTKAVEELLSESSVVVDGLLGTGFTHENVRTPTASYINAINTARAKDGSLFVISIDCPSGLNADNGSCASTTVRADVTITMLALKPGLLDQKDQYVGRLYLAPLQPLPCE